MIKYNIHRLAIEIFPHSFPSAILHLFNLCLLTLKQTGIRCSFVFWGGWNVNLSWLQTAVGAAADGLITHFKRLWAACTRPQQKSRRKTARVWCGEFSFTSILPTGAQGNIRLCGSQTPHQTCCAERSLTP